MTNPSPLELAKFLEVTSMGAFHLRLPFWSGELYFSPTEVMINLGPLHLYSSPNYSFDEKEDRYESWLVASWNGQGFCNYNKSWYKYGN